MLERTQTGEANCQYLAKIYGSPIIHLQHLSAPPIKVARTELEAEELQNLESKTFTTDRLKVVADYYLFFCYTGYAFVDNCKLTPQHVVRKPDGELWIVTAPSHKPK